ncbi:Zn-ribbon domain-containing OB-fold protein [Granulicoccus phenolivorans]|uniref:Zn-ribbon domain-containing OB-fold protein n=1 Tax=Granulicoccus phenolivorans TaxID=266854 RepID=UPI0003FF5084|nr:OB-fold domain-containing protein [Granulicoccus phenolivorans]
MASDVKPVPKPTAADQPYWDGLAEHRVVLARCTACGTYSQRLPMLCHNCTGEEFAWSQVSGRGSIYTYTVARQSWVEGFAEEIPYVVVSVALEEQPDTYLTTNLVGDYDLDELDLGLPVVAEFEARGDATLLQFRLDRSTHV